MFKDRVSVPGLTLLVKSVVKYTLSLHIGFFVCQYSKLGMLQFYYDFVDRYVERPLFQYCEMDTDSAYIALAGERIDGLVRADRCAHYFRHRSQWLPAECCDEHEDDYVCARIADRPWTVTESCCFHARLSTSEHRVYSRRCSETDSSVCAARPTTVLVPPTSIARKV